MPGKIIVIEGTDGSGKATQVMAVKQKAEKQGIPMIVFDFPRYDTHRGREIRKYLNGEFGDPTEVNPYFASWLYTMDRAEARGDMLHYLNDGVHILCNRYIGSNFAHQAAKLPENEWQKFVESVEYKEYEQFKVPKPDLTICLHVPRDEVVKAMNTRGREKDGHESNLDYQGKVIETYLWLARTKQDWRLIKCMDGIRRKSVEEVTEEIWRHVQPVLIA